MIINSIVCIHCEEVPEEDYARRSGAVSRDSSAVTFLRSHNPIGIQTTDVAHTHNQSHSRLTRAIPLPVFVLLTALLLFLDERCPK